MGFMGGDEDDMALTRCVILSHFCTAMIGVLLPLKTACSKSSSITHIPSPNADIVHVGDVMSPSVRLLPGPGTGSGSDTSRSTTEWGRLDH